MQLLHSYSWTKPLQKCSFCIKTAKVKNLYRTFSNLTILKLQFYDPSLRTNKEKHLKLRNFEIRVMKFVGKSDNVNYYMSPDI